MCLPFLFWAANSKIFAPQTRYGGLHMAKANAKFMAPLTPSAELAAVVGATPLPRTEIVKKMWEYIKKNGLQDQKNKRMINSDAKLAPIFEGKKQISMFDMSKYISKNVK